MPSRFRNHGALAPGERPPGAFLACLLHFWLACLSTCLLFFGFAIVGGVLPYFFLSLFHSYFHSFRLSFLKNPSCLFSCFLSFLLDFPLACSFVCLLSSIAPLDFEMAFKAPFEAEGILGALRCFSFPRTSCGKDASATLKELANRRRSTFSNLCVLQRLPCTVAVRTLRQPLKRLQTVF